MKGYSLKLSIEPSNRRITFLLSVLLALVSFPVIDPSYSIGLDCSAWYAINYFFHHGIQAGRDFIFTYGPLGFIESPNPLGLNLPFSIFFIFLVYFVFSYAALTLANVVSRNRWFLNLFLIFITCQLFFFEDLIIGIAAISFILFHETRKRKWALAGIAFSVAGLLLKSPIGLACASIVISYCLFKWWHTKRIKEAITILCLLLLFYSISWLIIYHNLQGSFTFLQGTWQLALGYGSALSVYAPNNIWLLGISVASFLLIPVLFRSNRVLTLYALMLLSVFFAWKHSYSREAGVYLGVFLHFLLLFFSLFLIYVEKIRLVHILLMVLSLTGAYKNIKLSEPDYSVGTISCSGFKNFNDAVFNYNTLVKGALAESDSNIVSKKLPAEVLKLIGQQSVDFYPTELGYAAANSLNWVPRPIIQGYISYTPWLDKQNANWFSSDKSANFILWQFSNDRWSPAGFDEVDDRFVLNNEPLALYQLLNHYSPVYKTKDFILFKRSGVENLNPVQIAGTETTTWNKWTTVPQLNNGILSARVNCLRNIWGFMKRILFKDELFFVDYKLVNGNIITYRFVPENAKNGLWINPFIRNPADTVPCPVGKVDSIRFRCTNTSLVQQSIDIIWELATLRLNSIKQDNKSNNAYALFMEYKSIDAAPSFHFNNDVEHKYEYWEYNDSNLTTETRHNGSRCELIGPKKNSSMFNFPLAASLNDSTSLTVNVSAWFKMSKEAKGSLVIQMFDANGSFYWNSWQLGNYIDTGSQWSQASAEVNFGKTTRKNTLVRVYLINDGTQRIWVDDIDIKLYSFRSQ